LAFGQTLLTNAGALEPRDRLEALDPRSGNLLWKRPPLTSMTVAGPTVAVGEDPAALVALGTDGVKLWQREGRLVAASEHRVFMYGPSALEPHAGVFARSTAKLQAVDTRTGRVLWAHAAQPPGDSEGAADDELLVLRGEGNLELVAFEAATGKLRWRESGAN
jgi:outer membrane protein assembly factor BamB